MESVIETLEKKDFVYFGVYVDAYINSEGKLKKRSLHPYGWQNLKETSLNYVYDRNYGINRDPNGCAINTELSNISVIDVDIPDECIILNILLKECNFIVKTRKGYHFYFKNNDLPRRKMCGIADINTELLYLVPEYQQFKYISEKEERSKKGNKFIKYTGYELFGDKYKYEIIKNKKLNDMSEQVYNWCKQLILNNDKEDKNIKNKNKKEYKKIVHSDIQINKFNNYLIRLVNSLHFDIN